jgi:adenylate kinase family enzyme
MHPIPPLEALGRRICIIGPSNSGKSTLAQAIGARLNIPVIYLDQLRHLPHTDWRVRPDAEFAALHARAIAGEAWVIEGNYSVHFPERFSRATAIIVLRGGRTANFLRYLRRTLFQTERAGHLDGALDSIKWPMIRWVLVSSHKNRKRYIAAVEATGLPVADLPRMRDVNAAYSAWGLRR